MRKLTLEHIVNIDYEVVEKLLSDFLREYLSKSGSRGYVVGVSGGLDSATALALAVKSVGVDDVFALIIPDKDTTPIEDVEDAVNLVERLNVRYHVIEISKAIDMFKKIIPIYRNDEEDKLPLGNLRARLRMCLLYYYANKLRYLVLGSSDRSEYLIGYFTKYGDGAADVSPLTTLYKTQVKKFAKHLGVPSKIVEKPSAPRLWPGHLAEEELGIKYEEIDLVLVAYVDLGIAEKEIHRITGIDKATIDKVLKMFRYSRHKRLGPSMPSQVILDTIRNMIIKNMDMQTQLF